MSNYAGNVTEGRAPSWTANVIRDVCACMLLLVGLVTPWNLYFGVGVPNSSGWLFALLVVATLLSLGSLGLRFAAGRRDGAASWSSAARWGLNAPYFLLVVGFVVFAIVQTVRLGGTGDVAPGIGPGALSGAAGVLLASQPVVRGADDHRFRAWVSATRFIGITAVVLATLSVLFNLYWRTRYVLPNLGDPIYGGQNVAVVMTALVYGAVALIGVLVGLRWLWQAHGAAQLATIALGASTLVGSVLVWTLGVGRDVDAFHGIAQNTSTAAIGFEGYLAWASAGAILAPLTLTRAFTATPLDKGVWRDAARKCLSLIAVWCVGSALLRIFDVIVAISLDLPISPYDSVALLAFDVVAAVVAVWVRVNFTNSSLHPAVISALCGVVFVLTVCRVAVGVGLAPRILYTAPPEGLDTAAYGNTLAHQITSTFDVVLCVLAAAVMAAAVLVVQLGGRVRVKRSTVVTGPKHAAANQLHVPVDAATQQLAAHDATQQWATTTEQMWAPPERTQKLASGAPRIARAEAEDQATQQISSGTPKIARVLQESTQRFAAGTTYTGSGRQEPPSGSGQGH